jgi:hypothetical protein
MLQKRFQSVVEKHLRLVGSAAIAGHNFHTGFGRHYVGYRMCNKTMYHLQLMRTFPIDLEPVVGAPARTPAHEPERWRDSHHIEAATAAFVAQTARMLFEPALLPPVDQSEDRIGG